MSAVCRAGPQAYAVRRKTNQVCEC